MTLSCATVRSRCDAYLAGSLPAREGLAVRAHLNGCPACRADVACARNVVAFVRKGSVVVPPPGYLASLPGRILSRTREGSADRRHRMAVVASCGLACAAAFALAVFGLRGTARRDALPGKPTAGALSFGVVGRPIGQRGPVDARPLEGALAERVEPPAAVPAVIWVTLVASASLEGETTAPVLRETPQAESPRMADAPPDRWVAAAPSVPAYSALSFADRDLADEPDIAFLRTRRLGSPERWDAGAAGLTALVYHRPIPVSDVALPWDARAGGSR